MIGKLIQTWCLFAASVSTIGTPCGCILAGYLTDLLGRKRTLIALQLPAIIGWLLVGSASSVHWIYVGRFLAGLSSGMIGAPSRVYTAEVSQPHVRGVLAAFASVGTSLGKDKIEIFYVIRGVNSHPIDTFIISIKKFNIYVLH